MRQQMRDNVKKRVVTASYSCSISASTRTVVLLETVVALLAFVVVVPLLLSPISSTRRRKEETAAFICFALLKPLQYSQRVVDLSLFRFDGTIGRVVFML